MPSPQQKQNLLGILPAAKAIAEKYGIPYRLNLAQWILESGWGEKMPPLSNNPFGIKSYPGCQGEVLADTQEWFTKAGLKGFLSGDPGRTARPAQPSQCDAKGRTLYDVKDWFATFPSMESAFEHHAQLFSKPVYRPALEAWQKSGKADADVARFIDAIAEHYSTTDPKKYAALAKQIAFGPAVSAVFAPEKAPEPSTRA